MNRKLLGGIGAVAIVVAALVLVGAGGTGPVSATPSASTSPGSR